MRIDSLVQQQKKLMSTFNIGMKSNVLALERLQKRTNALFRDVCLAQTMHPELSHMFKHFSSEICKIDLKFSQENRNSFADDQKNYSKLFCANQALTEFVAEVRKHRVADISQQQ